MWQHSEDCIAGYLGWWACEPARLLGAADAILAGKVRGLLRTAIWSGDDGQGNATFKPGNVLAGDKASLEMIAGRYTRSLGHLGARRTEDKPFAMTKSGVAVIGIQDFMMKGWSKYGGTSTVEARQQIRAAAQDGEVNSIMLLIDSPGGTVAGTQQLADEIATAATQKTVVAQVDDLMASAALWAGVQADQVFANRTAEIGSIGVFGVVKDTSRKAEMEGIKVHVISTGPYKGFADGAPITPEQLAEYQREVNGLNEHFLQAIQQGRGMALADVKKLADGRVWIADEARALGLIDGVQSADATLAGLEQRAAESRQTRAEVETRLRLS